MQPLAPGSTVGRYRIDGVLGRGGMATVYLATHETLGRPAALKLLEPGLAASAEFTGRFRREGRAQATLEHPHVVAVYETVETDDRLLIAMQLINGPTLAALIARGELSAARAIMLLGQIADAVDAAHAGGLVHRDIKPRNVLVAEGDHAYLADFGLTTLGDDSGFTVTGDVLGTVAYLAPEVIQGARATPASDRYAFAAMAFECLTGTVVFPRATKAAQLYAHTTDPVPRISARRHELPESLDSVFERALAKAPAARPAAAAAVVAAICDGLGEELVRTLPPPPPASSEAGAESSTASPVLPVHLTAAREALDRSRLPRRTRTAIAAAIAAAAAAGAAVGALAFGDGHDRRPGAVIPPPLKGMTVLGSDLAAPGSTRDCAGRPVRLESPDCSVLQAVLPERTIVVPRDGVVRRWAVRSAVGELQLQVLRSRDRQYRQLAVSRSEFVADSQVHAFATDLTVEAGDLLSLHVVSGSGVGIRPRPGATTYRFLPRLRGNDARPETDVPGLAGEVLLRIEYLPGGRQRVPPIVRGAAAAALEPGKLVRRRRARPPGGREIELRIVDVGQRFALDQFFRGRRVARLVLPGFVSGVGEIAVFDTYVTEGDDDVEIYIEYQRLDSARRLSHYVLALPHELTYIN